MRKPLIGAALSFDRRVEFAAKFESRGEIANVVIFLSSRRQQDVCFESIW